jgi:predicted nucleic acid-binding protein
MVGLAPLRGVLTYLDANVLIYAMEQVPGFTVAGDILRAIDRGEIHALTSDLTLAEALV